MKKIFSFIITLVMCLSFTSCMVPAEAQVYETYSYDDLDISVIISNGAPHYASDGMLLYYVYNNLYYYPYYYGNRWHFRYYDRPINHYRPVPRDFYRHRPTTSWRYYRKHFNGHTPNGGSYRHNGTFNRHNGHMRGGTINRPHQRPPRMNNGGGRFGGRR